MNKKIFLSMLIACVATLGVNAQQQQGKELNKEITLEKDFVPVVKKVTKKNTLPKVKKIAAPAKTDLKYSETPVNIEVPTTIPTMMPYGYRTAHNFSDKRGYLEVGGGMAANFDGSAGYRFVDSDNTQAGIWIQHNSTWADKNKTQLITDDEQRAKQVFNDNRGGLYLTNHFGDMGVLKLDAGVHFDSFNYYGAHKVTSSPQYDVDKKQSFMEFGLIGKWNGKLNINSNTLPYRFNLGFNHAGYDMVPSPYATGKGASENLVKFGVGADYELEDYGTISLDVKGDYVNFKGAQDYKGALYEMVPDNSYFLFTLAPRYKWENEVFRAEVGADLIFGDIHNELSYGENKNSKFHIAPAVKLDVDIVDGAAIYVDLGGGNTINSLSHMASIDRYSTPLGVRTNNWSQIDGEAGFKFGPFQGFNAKLFAGYGLFKGALLVQNRPNISTGLGLTYACNTYARMAMRGLKFGGELNYKYRSLVEVAAGVTFTPTNDGLLADEWDKGYCLGLDGAGMVANVDVKVTPISKLSINAGMNYRGKRSSMLDTEIGFMHNEMDDAINVYAGASYRINKTVSVWVKANNLLNRKYDILPGQGAQGLNAMGGVSLVF